MVSIVLFSKFLFSGILQGSVAFTRDVPRTLQQLRKNASGGGEFHSAVSVVVIDPATLRYSLIQRTEKMSVARIFEILAGTNGARRVYSSATNVRAFFIKYATA